MGHREEPPRECTRCGACCFSESLRHARVSGDDYERLGDEAARLVTWVGNEAFMRLGGTTGTQHCVALVLDVGTPAESTFSCAIYERRPQVCRDLERGGSGCRGERDAKAGRPAQALLHLTARDRSYR